jgi:hypothetical protein
MGIESITDLKLKWRGGIINAALKIWHKIEDNKEFKAFPLTLAWGH